MHILDRIQCIDIQSCQPVHHHIILLNYFLIIQILTGDRCVCRADLISRLEVTTAVHGVQQTLCKVCTCTEKLHFLTGLCCGYTAADRIVITPYWPHHVIVLILDRARTHRNNCCIFLKVLRQMGRIQHREVWLRRRPHILQRMEETVIRLCHHGTSIHAKASHFQGRPYRVTGKQLIVRRNARKFYHAALHNEVIDQLLCLCLCDRSVLQISLNINIEEGRHTADAHCRTVLCLDCSEISKVQPLYCLMRIFSRAGNIIAINSCHFLHFSERTDLL